MTRSYSSNSSWSYIFYLALSRYPFALGSPKSLSETILYLLWGRISTSDDSSSCLELDSFFSSELWKSLENYSSSTCDSSSSFIPPAPCTTRRRRLYLLGAILVASTSSSDPILSWANSSEFKADGASVMAYNPKLFSILSYPVKRTYLEN